MANTSTRRGSGHKGQKERQRNKRLGPAIVLAIAALKHKAGLPTNREVVELMAARYHVEKFKETEREPS